MLGRQNRERGDKAVALLATCLVVLGGAIASGFVLLSTGNDAQNSVWMWAGSFAGIVVILWLIRERSERGDRDSAARAWFWSRKANSDELPVIVRRREPVSQADQAPSPTPPTVERVREITEIHNQNTWVPAKKGRKPPADS